MNAIPLYKKHNVSCSAITQCIFFSKNQLENIKKCIINSEDMLIIFFKQNSSNTVPSQST